MVRSNNNNILVPTDFSDVAHNALSHALKIAEVYGNEITLLNIQDDSGFKGFFGNEEKLKLIEEAVQSRFDKLIEECKITAQGVKINKIIAYGKIYKVVNETAETGNYDSIVMGTNGASGLGQIIGSNSSRVINYAKIPVIVVKEKPIDAGGYEKIVLPIDLSIESRQKVKWAVHLAKKFNSEIHVIYENFTDKDYRNKIHAVVNQTQDILDVQGVKYVVRGLDDEKYPDGFAEDTLNYAIEISADLIIIMTQQEKGFSEFLLGSYAQQIVNHGGSVPVMCVNSASTGVILDGAFS